MILPKDVEPFDEAAQKSIASLEDTIDKKLSEDKLWEHSYTSSQHPERFANIARRYQEAGWAVVVYLTEIAGGYSYKLSIKHPAQALPRELTYTLPTVGRR